MRNSRRIILWLVPLALCTLDSQSSTASAGEAALPASDAAPGTASLKPSEPHKTQVIPWDQIGAKAGADYHGDGLAVVLSPEGARLHCVFQRLEGEATTGGLWLTSAVTNQPNDRFQVKAARLGRVAATSPLPETGTVSVTGQTVRFARAGLVEEYEVSMDGVRQDFVVTAKPAGAGELEVGLSVTGARVEATTYGAQLVLENSGRKIAYSRLHATDATGKDLPTWIEVRPDVAAARESAADKTSSDGGVLPKRRYVEFAVIVNDAGAVYPVRIDPTFSDADWISMGGVNGTDGPIYTAAMDGSGNLYIGGQFTVVGNVIAYNIAEWNGSSWSALGSGMNGRVAALAMSGGTLYAGGYFTMATNTGNAALAVNGIAQWNGSSWSPLGSGMAGGYLTTSVNALAVSGGTLYAGGNFIAAGGKSAFCIAQWNGSTWSPLGSGMGGGSPSPSVYALAVLGGTLFAGGNFTTAGNTSANYVAQWNGSSWSPLDFLGMNSYVNALAVSGSTLYAGGNFTMAGGNAANYLAQWNSSGWLPVGSGMNSAVNALAVSGATLYAGGNFTTASGNAVNYLAQWNGSSWSPLGTGMNSDVYALAVSKTDLYAGGSFATAGCGAANRLAHWNGSSWSPLGVGMNGAVFALAVSGGTLYAGGEFEVAGGNAANYLAQWNGSSWSPLGSGMNGYVLALAVSGTNLYAGGDFTTATNSGNAAVTVNYLAQWNGSSWSPLGSGMNGYVLALAVSGTNLYAGGDFTTAANSGNAAATVNYLAQWNGSSWSSVGSGMNSDVNALAVSGGTLYAAGAFTTATNSGNAAVAVNYIAQWDASGWSPLGVGLGNSVLALAVSGDTLYAGGYFTTAGGGAANHIAQWNGSGWLPLGSGIDYTVSALAVSGGTLYAGGDLTMAGGNVANHIAQWNGSTWSPLGSGINDYVEALAVSGGMLYVGGAFTTAGGKASGYAAEAVLDWPTIEGSSVCHANGSVTLNLSTVTNCQSRLYAATNLNSPVVWQPICTNGNGGAWQFVDTNTAGCKNKYYRVSTP